METGKSLDREFGDIDANLGTDLDTELLEKVANSLYFYASDVICDDKSDASLITADRRTLDKILTRWK